VKNKIILIIIIAICQVAISQVATTNSNQKIERENIEWCDIWVANAKSDDKPRILLIGDSILIGYYKSVSEYFEGNTYCARFATSACVADPAFLQQLGLMLSQYDYSVIHFNNGLHGIGYTEGEYQTGYEKALQLIKKRSPQSKLVLALSTPLQSTSEKNYLNPRIDERNQIVRGLAKKYDASVNDLNSISKDHPEYYKDPYHFKTEAITLQGELVVDTIKNLLMESK
jgi:lysophospholipase L1-like esterase